MIRQLALPSLMLAVGVVGVGVPVSLGESAGLAPATVECASCCQQEGATCVICGTDACSAYSDYYEGKVGPGGCDGTRT